MSNYFYEGPVEIYIDDEYIEVEVYAEASGFYKAGDSFGYGCEPPDGDFEIGDVEYRTARVYDEDGNMREVEITDEIKKLVKSALNKVSFDEIIIEPDYDDYYEW